MNVAKMFVIELVVFVLVAGGSGYWIYDRYESIASLETTLASKRSTLKKYRDKVAKIDSLEDKKNKLEVRRNDIEVAVPQEGSQSSLEIMEIIDNIKKNVENVGGVDIPLLLIKQGSIDGLEEKVTTKKTKKSNADYKPITIKLSLLSTWLGHLRFIDLLEKDDQIFKVVSISGSGSNSDEFPEDEEELTVEKMKEESPFDYPIYVKSDIVITTYHLLKRDKK